MEKTHLKIEYQEFDDNYEKFKNNNYFFGLFKGNIDPATGHNWCGDCEEAEPIINSSLLPECQKKNIIVLDVSVGPKLEWKSPDHPLRKNPKINLKKVPTLALFKEGKVVLKLEEGQINQDAIEEVLNDLA